MSTIDPIEFGEMRSDVNTLKAQMSELRTDVRKLLDIANQGKGGLWMFRTGYVTAGGVLAWALEHYLRK